MKGEEKNGKKDAQTEKGSDQKIVAEKMGSVSMMQRGEKRNGQSKKKREMVEKREKA